MDVTGRVILAVIIVMLVLATGSVILRFMERHWSKLPLAWSDWLILLALAYMVVYASALIHYTIKSEDGSFDLYQMAEADKYNEISFLLQNIYIADIFSSLTLSTIKLSISCFYHDLFGISKRFRISNQTVAALCIAWLFAGFLITVLQCIPVSKLWDSFGDPKYCWANGGTWFGLEFASLALDIALLCLPLIMIKRLKLSRAKKISLGAIFLLGGLACIVGVVKLVFVWTPSGSHGVNLFVVSLSISIQLGMAFMCASLPTYASFIGGTRWKSSRSTKDAEETYVLRKDHTPDIQITDMEPSSNVGVSNSFRIDNTEPDNASITAEEMQPGSIYVRHSIYVV